MKRNFNRILLRSLQLLLLLASCLVLRAEITLTAPAEGSTLSLMNEQQRAYVLMPREERIPYFADEEKRLEMQSAGYHPLAIKFAWEDTAEAENYRVTLATNPDFEDAVVRTTDKLFARIDNLMIAKKYYWKVEALGEDVVRTSGTGTFLTEDLAPRLVRIDGVPNVRDLGGRKGRNGKRVKQGMIYRTAGLNDNAKAVNYTLTEIAADPELRSTYANHLAWQIELLQTIGATETRLKGAPDFSSVPATLKPEWTVFRPDPAQFELAPHHQMMAELRSIPPVFLGAKAEQVVTDENGAFKFDETILNAPAIFMQEIEAAADGLMFASFGADWFWDLRVNGTKVFDLLAGNQGPSQANAHKVAIPVHEGKNLLVALVRSGSAGWIWAWANLPQPPEAVETLSSKLKLMKAGVGHPCEILKETVPGKNRLDDATRRYVLEDLGVKIDIDLRNNRECWGMKGSPLGDDAVWHQISSSSYGRMQEDFGRQAFTRVFRLFLDEKNYPLIFHCIAGQDRTGAVAFIINGLMGVELEELYLDWEVTGFWNKSVAFNHELRFDHLVAGFEKLPGETIHDKIEHYVLSLGFTREDIEHLRNLLLE